MEYCYVHASAEISQGNMKKVGAHSKERRVVNIAFVYIIQFPIGYWGEGQSIVI